MVATKYHVIQDRDKRYDGKFYFAVKTTGIVCKPSCPATRPLEKNVEFYNTLEEALAKGFRPCKRCKPEQLAQSSIVSRITMLDQTSVSGAAHDLGVSERHLRRLTQKQIGMSPHKVTQAKRIAEAKRLLAGTKLSITDVAFSAGFESLRQFNDSFKNETKLAPREYRHANSNTIGAFGKPIGVSLRLPFKKPLDWQPLKKALLAHMIPGLEHVDNEEQTLTRLVQTNFGYAKMILDLDEPKDTINALVYVTDMNQTYDVAQTIKRVLDLDHDPAHTEVFYKNDPLLRPLALQHPGLRVCGMFDPYELLINTILGQQVSVPAARTFSERLVKQYGTLQDGLYLYPNAEILAQADPTEIYQTTKINHKKVATIQAVCQLLASGFDLSSITKNDEARQTLLDVKGIGPWTVEYVILRGFGDPDGFPADDLFIKRFLGVKTAKEAEQFAEKWRPYRGYATMQLCTKGTYE